MNNAGVKYVMISGILAVVLAGCGGSSSSQPAAAVGLAVASKVSAVDPKGASLSKVLAKSLLSVAPTFPATADFTKDPTFVYVQDRTTESLDNVNQILCMISQTQYASMVNAGPYRALVDQNLCGGGGESSSGGAPSYNSWTLNVTRADNNSPEVVSAWVHQTNNGGEQVINARLIVTEASSATDPTGLFTINYAAYPATNGVPTSTTPVEKGILQATKDNVTGKVTLSMVSNSANDGLRQVAFSKSADGTTGSGSVANSASPNNAAGGMNFAYNTTAVDVVPNGKAAICLDRTNYAETAWSYGLYDANGARVNVDAGFPISVVQGGATYQGWIGYFGAWLPNGINLANGETVTKLTNNGTAAGTYTALTGHGRLTKHTRKLLHMADIQGIPLRYSVFSTTPNTPSTDYRVIWNGTNLIENGTWDNSSNSWFDMANPVTLNLSAVSNPSLAMNSDALGGQVFIQDTCTPNASVPGQPQTFACTVSSTTQVVFYDATTVFPGDTSVPATLACSTNCPDPANTTKGANQMTTTETGFVNSAPATASTNGKLATYAFNAATYALTRGGVAVDGTATGLNLIMGGDSGPLFDPSVTANMNVLACNNGGTTNASQTCGWQAWSGLTEFYTWSTGTNNWQTLTALVDSNGKPVTFAQPLQVLYVHNGDGYTNSSFYLQYNGFGNLNGIPGQCVNGDTGLKVDCSQQQNNPQVRWVPQFTIKAGETVTGPASATFYVKPLQVEQRMLAAAAGACAALNPTTYTLPTLGNWTDPALGTEPATGPAKVIGGVIQ